MTRLNLAFVIALCAGLALAFVASPALSEPTATDRQIPYQGYLEMNGQPVDGSVKLVFTLSDGADAGKAAWSETHDLVPVSAGRFSVVLGSIDATAVPDWAFLTNALDLQIGVNDGPTLTNKQRIRATPYAVTAVQAGEARGALDARLAAIEGRLDAMDASSVSTAGKSGQPIVFAAEREAECMPATVDLDNKCAFDRFINASVLTDPRLKLLGTGLYRLEFTPLPQAPICTVTSGNSSTAIVSATQTKLDFATQNSSSGATNGIKIHVVCVGIAP